MAAPQITALVTEVYTPVPQRTQGQAAFDANADAFLASLPGVATSINTVSGQINAVADYVEDAVLEVDGDRIASEAAATLAEAHKNAAAVSATNSANSATASAASATTAQQQAALATASVANGAKPYATYAAALADLANIATNQIIEVVTDETRSSQRSLYQDNGTTLVFLRAVEQYVSPFSYIQSDSFQNMITKLLMVARLVPQNPPVIDANFADPAYFV